MVQLAKTRGSLEVNLARLYQEAITKRAWLKVAENATPNVRVSLEKYRSAIMRIGKGTGKGAHYYRREAREASAGASAAIPCWIMPHYRISESLPAEFGSFDLVIIDEASQSDLTALPAIMRAKKVLIVGDDKQVSPEGVGLDIEKIRNLMAQYLSNQVPKVRIIIAEKHAKLLQEQVLLFRAGLCHIIVFLSPCQQNLEVLTWLSSMKPLNLI